MRRYCRLEMKDAISYSFIYYFIANKSYWFFAKNQYQRQTRPYCQKNYISLNFSFFHLIFSFLTPPKYSTKVYTHDVIYVGKMLIHILLYESPIPKRKY